MCVDIKINSLSAALCKSSVHVLEAGRVVGRGAQGQAVVSVPMVQCPSAMED